MAYEHREGQGAIFKNTKKEPNTKQPDYRGNIMLGGVVYEIAGWTKNAGKGPFLSIVAKPEGDRPKKETYANPKDDDLIPF